MKKPYVITIEHNSFTSIDKIIIYARSVKGAVKKYYKEYSNNCIVKSVEELKYLVKKSDEENDN